MKSMNADDDHVAPANDTSSKFRRFFKCSILCRSVQTGSVKNDLDSANYHSTTKSRLPVV